MAFSDTYTATRNALKVAIKTAWGLTDAQVHFGAPEIELDPPYAVISGGSIRTSYGHPAGSGSRPGQDLELQVFAVLAYPSGATGVEDAALGFADSLCAQVEAGTTLGSMMQPILSNVSLEDLTGLIDGTGERRLQLQMTVSGVAQRARG